MPYHQAWRVIQEKKGETKMEEMKSYGLVIPFLESLKESNPGSTVEYEVDSSTSQLKRLFFCPAYASDILQYLRPVIAIDSAALKGEYGGTIETFTLKSANNENYLIAFGITYENEDQDNWDFNNLHFKSSMPSLFADRNDQDHNASDILVNKHHKYDASFIADRDKGIEASIAKFFPDHHLSRCAFHIAENVRRKFGQRASSHVVALSKSFSTRQDDFLLERIRQCNERAVSYVLNIPKRQWRSSQWLVDQTLPPRFGIVTSNSAESVNSWISSLRMDGSWLGLLEGVVSKMATMISEKRQQYKKNNDFDVVPWVRQMLLLRWNASASMQVMEVSHESGKFSVREPSNNFIKEDDGNVLKGEEHEGLTEEEHQVMMPKHTTQTINRHHNIVPWQGFCTCGRWQENRFPCRHAVAYFRHWEKMSFEDIVSTKTHYYYSFKALKKLYEPCIAPVVTDLLINDNKTKPPPCEKRRAGRPQKKRLRARSKYQDPKVDSVIRCSECGEKGHNKRTCERRKQEIMTEATKDDKEGEVEENEMMASAPKKRKTGDGEESKFI